MRTVEQRVLEVLTTNLIANPPHLTVNPPVKLTDRLAEDLEADSLEMLEIAMAIEEEFGVEIPEEAYLFETAGDIVDWLNQKGIVDG
jgi:acyl carrier protein